MVTRDSRTEQQLRAILDANADGIVVVGRDETIRFANPATEQIFARPATELVGRPFGYPLMAGRTAEIDVLRPGGETVVAEMRVVEVEWEGQPAFLASLRDITERKQGEAAQAQLLLEQAARHAAEKALRDRDRLFQVMNHEFRTPLTRLRLWVRRAMHCMEDGLAGGTESAVQALTEAELEVETLTRLVAQLLEITRLESGERPLAMEQIDLCGLVQRHVRRMAGATEAIVLQTLPGRLLVHADKKALEQILDGTLIYALRHTRPGAPVEVGIAVNRPHGPGAEQPAEAQIAVRHRGAPLHYEPGEPLFGRSFTGHSSGNAGGLGLWFYVSRRLAELHGGRMEAGTPPDGGVVITVALPIA